MTYTSVDELKLFRFPVKTSASGLKLIQRSPARRAIESDSLTVSRSGRSRPDIRCTVTTYNTRHCKFWNGNGVAENPKRLC